MEQAIQDIKYLSERFQGIIEAGNFLSDYDTLTKQSAEMASLVETLKGKVEEENLKLQNVREESRFLVEDAGIKSHDLYQAAQREINLLQADSQRTLNAAYKTLADFKSDAADTMADLNKQISDKKFELHVLAADVSSQMNTLADVKAQIKKLKETL